MSLYRPVKKGKPLMKGYAITKGVIDFIKPVYCGVCNKQLKMNNTYKYAYGSSIALDAWFCNDICVDMFVLQRLGV